MPKQIIIIFLMMVSVYFLKNTKKKMINLEEKNGLCPNTYVTFLINN
jgi:hypothetical protein